MVRVSSRNRIPNPKTEMKPFKFQRTPTELVDGLTIYCHRMREEGKTLYSIAEDVGKDHSTVVYHLQRYKDLMSVDKTFQRTEKEFSVSEFLDEYHERVMQQHTNGLG